MVVVQRTLVILVTGTLGFSGAALGQTPSDPPSRVGRLAHVQGTVSFHDTERPDWEPATVNRPLSAGDSLWTEPSSKAEVSIGGTQVRLDGATQLDLQAFDDQQTRLQLSQGRVDIKTFAYDAKQPYDVVTPRGIATLQQQGDYYVQAGSTQDPTRLGVRKGAAQFQAPDGRVLAVRAGEVAEITGDGSDMKLSTIQSAPPPVPQYWAQRDRIVSYDQPQYLSTSVTGYEDLNHYGTWQNDAEYGQVWYARDVPQGWQPYSTGRWSQEPVYGWTWIDEQPWGFAPYHYGRWAQRNNRWFWVPPERAQPAVYAPALVAFVGGTELGLALGLQSRQPVGWFPLGPREIYVPPYTTNRDYYRRMNLNARIQDRMLEDRWDRIQRREAIADQNWMNRRFATVVPADAFARSQPVERVRLRIQPDRLASVPVASVAVPPSPTVSVRALTADQAQRPDRDGRPDQADRQDRDRDGRPDQANRQDRDRDGRPDRPGEPNARVGAGASAPAMIQAIKAEPQKQKAPGPQIVSRTNATANTDAQAGASNEPGKAEANPGKAEANKALPQLAPRNAKAPPPQIQGERKPAATEPGSQQANAPANRTDTPRPGEPAKPGEPQANAPAAKPGEPPKANEPPKPGEPRANAPADRAQPGQPGQANLPPVRDRNDQRPEPPKPGQQADTKPNAPGPNAPAPNPAQPQKPGEPPKPASAPQASKPDDAPKPPQAQAPQQRQATPQPQRQAEPPKPPQAQPQQRQAEPQPQRQAEPPKPPQQATPPAQPQPQQRAPQAQPQKERETRAAPPQQPQPQAAPPQPQRQAAPQPQSQHQQPQQQAQQPRPQPQQQQAQPQPQQQPQRQAAPQQQPQQQAQQPRPQQQQPQHQQQAQQKDDKKN